MYDPNIAKFNFRDIESFILVSVLDPSLLGWIVRLPDSLIETGEDPLLGVKINHKYHNTLVHSFYCKILVHIH